MSEQPVTANDARWDAQTLIDANEIKIDSKRFKKAVGAAQQLAVEKAKQASAAKKVSRLKKTSKKSSGKKK